MDIIKHPAILLFAQGATAAGLISFTPASSLIRIAALPVLGAFTATLVQSCKRYAQTGWTNFAASYSCIILMQYLNKAVLKKADANRALAAEAPKQKSPKPYVVGSLKRYMSGISIMASLRTAKDCPPFSNKDPMYVPSRRQFLVRSGITFVACYTILDLVTSQPPPVDFINLIAPGKEYVFSRWADITLEDVLVRVSVVVSWLISGGCFLRAITELVSFLAVALRLSEPADWKPPFGSWSSLYSLRSAWGSFWHQLLRRPLSAPVIYFLHDVLGLQGSATRWALTVLLVFALSGLLHTVSDLAASITFQESGSLHFFCVQPLGILVEHALCTVACRFAIYNYDDPPRWARCLGYLWIALWCLWTLPMMAFPQIRRATLNKEIPLPFSIVGLLI